MATNQNKASPTAEANAISGSWRQYEYSASVLFRHMQDGTLEAISMAEPAAGIPFHRRGLVRFSKVSQKFFDDQMAIINTNYGEYKTVEQLAADSYFCSRFVTASRHNRRDRTSRLHAPETDGLKLPVTCQSTTPLHSGRPPVQDCPLKLPFVGRV